MTKLSLLNSTRQLSACLFVAAALLLTACGGGSSGYPPITNADVSPSEGQADSDNALGNNHGEVDDGTSEPVADSGDSVAGDNGMSGTVDSGASTSEPETAGTDPGLSDGNATEGEESSSGGTLVMLEWDLPDQRENGEYLEDYEIGGYELRLQQAGESDYDYIIVEDGTVSEYELGRVQGEYEIMIAVYDIHGRYSDFVKLN